MIVHSYGDEWGWEWKWPSWREPMKWVNEDESCLKQEYMYKDKTWWISSIISTHHLLGIDSWVCMYCGEYHRHQEEERRKGRAMRSLSHAEGRREREGPGGREQRHIVNEWATTIQVFTSLLHCCALCLSPCVTVYVCLYHCLFFTSDVCVCVCEPFSRLRLRLSSKKREGEALRRRPTAAQGEKGKK